MKNLLARLRLAWKHPRWRRALIVAIAFDALGYGVFGAPPLIWLLDGFGAMFLFIALGFRWALLPALLAEAIPGLALFPAWTLVVLAMAVTDSDSKEGSMPKTLTRSEMAAQAAALKAGGKKLVFTNGVFDILHVGHLRYLNQARGLGDALVIGLNSDASVKRLKGDKRPILPEAERAELLAGLACVDYVCIFEEDDPRELIKAIVPSVLVKGGDWPIDKILGRDTVEAAGGKVLSLPFVEGRSTTSIVQDIARKFGADFKE